MGKWNVHRPTLKPSAPGRWTLHSPEKANKPEGHGWHLEEHTPKHSRWTCDYGCKSFVWMNDPQPGQYHAWDCPYWTNEGKHLTPF